jgi:hypothetical protein
MVEEKKVYFILFAEKMCENLLPTLCMLSHAQLLLNAPSHVIHVDFITR